MFIWFVILLGSFADARGQETRVWAVGDGVRVNPVTGAVFEARPDIHKDYPPGDPRQGNSVWNPQTKTVSLKAARNEFVAFQVILETDSQIQDANVRVSALKGPAGAVIERPNIAVFKEWYVQRAQGDTATRRVRSDPVGIPMR